MGIHLRRKPVVKSKISRVVWQYRKVVISPLQLVIMRMILVSHQSHPFLFFQEVIFVKKESKTIKRTYAIPRNCDPSCPEYYGIVFKDGHVRIDTKRYKKFFKLPDDRMELRNTVYYQPTRIHELDYMCNYFRNRCKFLEHKYNTEFKPAIEAIKSPKQVEDELRTNLVNSGETYEEAQEKAIMKGIKRINPYKYAIKSLYAQFFHQMMAEIDAQACRVMIPHGFREDDFSKKSFDVFIQSKQGSKAKPFKEFENYNVYDRAYAVWNFLKHNSKKSYDILCEYYPEMVYDPDKQYKNGDLALSVLKLDERYILSVLKNIHLFFDEVCVVGFNENVRDASWDYEEYFLNEVNQYIKNQDL